MHIRYGRNLTGGQTKNKQMYRRTNGQMRADKQTKKSTDDSQRNGRKNEVQN